MNDIGKFDCMTLGSGRRRCRRPKRMTRTLTLCGLLMFAAPALPQPLPGADIEGSKLIAEKLIEQRRQMDSLLWAPEVLAQKYETRFTGLWDALLTRDDKLEVLASFPFSKLVLGKHLESRPLELNIAHYRYGPGGLELTQDGWRAFLSDLEKEGYSLVHSEWHHSQFQPAKGDEPARSKVSMVLHIAKQEPPHRVIVRAKLDVTWASKFDAAGEPVPDLIEVSSMDILEREKPVAFREVLQVAGTDAQPLVHPILVYDLDGDGLSEIIVGGQNLLIRNRGGGRFETEPLLPKMRPIYDGAVLGDFTGDGHVDLVAVDRDGYPLLFEGDGEGRFPRAPMKIADTHFNLPKTFTAGDIDGDGDLDLYIANYKYAYRQGQMPTPYFDANDGYPAYLLRNDGHGNFTDVTAAAGLAAKRFRRAYSSSFVDLDDDLDQDLIVVSDYAGFDIYLNDGHGSFTDVSDQFGLDRHFFGMGHTFGDYNLDGKLDFYVIGMSSTTARRLEMLGVGRNDKPEHTRMRAAMGYGNRMFLRGSEGFERLPFNDQIARTGWSWGASSFDFDNDGDKDIFVANGHYSGASTQDYCTTFWRHDIYEEGSKADLAKDYMFQSQSSALRHAEISWNGYEHKVLWMNRQGREFVNIAFLMGVAFEYDGRAVVSDDLDADGRVDLLVTQFETDGLDRNRYTLHVYQNQLEQAGNWIGVRLHDRPNGYSTVGATVSITAGNGRQMSRIVTGDSFSAQHAATAHFGLGAADAVESIEVRWANGEVMRIEQPAANSYHDVVPPGGDQVRRTPDSGTEPRS